MGILKKIFDKSAQNKNPSNIKVEYRTEPKLKEKDQNFLSQISDPIREECHRFIYNISELPTPLKKQLLKYFE